MTELVGDMAPAIVALAIGAFLAAIAFSVRRRMIGDARAQQRRILAQAEARRRKVLESNPILVAGASRPRPDLDLEALAEVIPGFDLAALLDQVGAWFRDIQARHATGSRSGLDAYMLSGAVDVAMNSGPGLEAVGRAWLMSVRPEKLGGTVDGCEAQINVQALVEERRAGRDNLVEVSETWHLGWPPAHGAWRVVQVERRWRRVLDAPRILLDAEPPAGRARIDDLLESRRDRVDLDAVVAAAQLVVPEWAGAASAGAPARLDGLATAGFQEQVAGWRARHLHFGTEPTWSVEVEDVTPTRALAESHRSWVTVRVVGTSTLVLTGGPHGDGEAHAMRWSTYATFRSEPDGSWRIAWTVDDDDWTVGAELPE